MPTTVIKIENIYKKGTLDLKAMLENANKESKNGKFVEFDSNTADAINNLKKDDKLQKIFIEISQRNNKLKDQLPLVKEGEKIDWTNASQLEALHQFLATEFSTENLNFHLALAQLKQKANIAETFHEEASQFYKEFLKEGSNQQVNIPYTQLKPIEELMATKNYTPQALLEVIKPAEDEVYKLMGEDSIARFKSSTFNQIKITYPDKGVEKRVKDSLETAKSSIDAFVNIKKQERPLPAKVKVEAASEKLAASRAARLEALKRATQLESAPKELFEKTTPTYTPGMQATRQSVTSNESNAQNKNLNQQNPTNEASQNPPSTTPKMGSKK